VAVVIQALVAAGVEETEAIVGTALVQAELLAIRVLAEAETVATMAVRDKAAEAVVARAVGSMVTKLLAVAILF
jgi:hypothetical protein